MNKNGVVLSSNPVWNVCASGKPVSLGLIRSNTDTVSIRRGHMKKEIPMTCRDYHMGDVSVWSHPDFPGLAMTLDKKGRIVGGLPAGYIAVRDSATPIAADGNLAKK